jgi:hypothetical protein
VAEADKTDLVSAWAIGIGIGLIALQVTWLIANRCATLAWGVPVGPTVALATALVAGIIVSVVMGKRLATKMTIPYQIADQASRPR